MSKGLSYKSPDLRLRDAGLTTQLVQWGFRFVALTLGGIHVWLRRHYVNPDGLSYLEIGEALWTGPASGAVNSYWSPLYAWIVGTALKVTGFRTVWEATAAHAVNFVIYFGALLAFEFFWRALGERRGLRSHEDGSFSPFGSTAWWALGYGLFLWASLALIKVWFLTPDLLLGAILFVIAGLLLIHERSPSAGSALLLGLSLGVSYLAKAVMFPLAPIYISSLAVLTYRKSNGIRARRAKKIDKVGPSAHGLLAIAVFLAIALPWIVTLRAKTDIWTFGETGKLNYAWYVNDVQRFTHWQGEQPTYGTPDHSTRVICEDPTIYEFDGPVHGTYPPWLDPAHWYRGVEIRFEPATQLRALASGLRYYVVRSWGLPIFLILLAAALLGTLRGVGRAVEVWFRYWPITLPSLAACALYALVHVEPRFIGGHIVIVAGTVLASARAPATDNRRTINWFAVFWTSALLFVVGKASVELYEATPRPTWSSASNGHHHWTAASALRASGLREGDKVAAVGYNSDAYWARLAGVSIVAEIPWHDYQTASPDAELVAADPTAEATAIDCLSSLEVRAIVMQMRSGTSMGLPWRRVPFDRQFDLWVRYLR